jgi:hypothetical protein
MFNIVFTDKFTELLYIDNYLISGFYCILNTIYPYEDTNSSVKFGQGGDSDVFIANTFMEDNGFAISLNLSKVDALSEDKYRSMYLYYVDYFKNPSLGKSNLKFDEDTDYITARKNALAAIIYWDSQDWLFSVNEIIKFPYPNGMPTCSFNCYSATDDQKELAIEVDHYNSTDYGQEVPTETSDDLLIMDKAFGTSLVKNKLSDLRASTLRGAMRIKNNGVIQL